MVVYGAALAPAEPSVQDRKVASAATQMMAQARADIMAQSQEERAEKDSASEIESENRSMDTGSISEKTLSSASRSDEVLQSGLLMQNLNSNRPIENPDRNQFDLRMQFSAGNLLSTLR